MNNFIIENNCQTKIICWIFVEFLLWLLAPLFFSFIRIFRFIFVSFQYLVSKQSKHLPKNVRGDISLSCNFRKVTFLHSSLSFFFTSFAAVFIFSLYKIGIAIWKVVVVSILFAFFTCSQFSSFSFYANLLSFHQASQNNKRTICRFVRPGDVTLEMWSHTFTVVTAAPGLRAEMLHEIQILFIFVRKRWFNTRKMNKGYCMLSKWSFAFWWPFEVQEVASPSPTNS